MYLLVSRLLKAGHRRHIALLVAALAFVVLAGGGAFAATQHLPYTTGLYWAIVTASTVGYGDVTPVNGAGRVIASVVMLTAIPLLGAVFALFAGASVSAGIRRIMSLDTSFPTGRYRLVLGLHPTTLAVVSELARADDAVVVVADIDPASTPDEVHVIRGDPTDAATLTRARPAGAQHALLTAGSDGDVLVMAVLLHQLAPELPVTALTASSSVHAALQALGVDQALSVEDLVAHTLAKSLETPHAGDLLVELVDSELHRLVEVATEGAAVGRALSAVRDDPGQLVLGVVRDGQVTLGIAEDPVLAEGDSLLVVEPVPRDGKLRRRD